MPLTFVLSTELNRLVLFSNDFIGVALIAWLLFPSFWAEDPAMGVLPSATEPGRVWVTQLVLPEEQMIEVILFTESDLLVTDYTSSMGLE